MDLLAERLKSIQKPYQIDIKRITTKLTINLDTTFLKIQEWILQKNRKKEIYKFAIHLEFYLVLNYNGSY